MTVNTIGSIAEFDTNGVTTNFPFFFKFLANEDLVVTYVDPLGTSSTLTLGTHYTANGAGNDQGGSIVTTSALAGPGQLIVSREMEAFQQTSLRNQGKFLAETHEDVFDRLTMLIQQGFAIFKRALTRPFGRDYFFAENRRITNVKDPVEQQDAATVAWTDRFVAGLIGAITGPINNALNIFFKGPDGSSHVVQDLTGRTTGNGADLITLGAANVVGDLARESVDLGASLLPGAVRSIPTVADLRLLTGTRADQIVLLEVDGSGVAPGLFKWTPASVLADDGYQVVKPTATATGRWIRFYMESSVTSSLRGMVIAVHYNLEYEPAKLDRLKSMGFNTIVIYRGAPWMGNAVRSLAFLDLLGRHGIRAIFQPDVTVVANSVYGSTPASIAEFAWLNAIKNHAAIQGWWSVDEPVAQNTSITIQQNFRTAMNGISTKHVFMAEAGSELNDMDGFYSSLGYDVLLFDIYLKPGTEYTDEASYKAEHARRIMNLISYDGFNDPTQKRRPGKVIPILPLFAGEGFTAPTVQTNKWSVECFQAFFGGSEYAIFAHDVPAAHAYTETLDTSQNMRNLATNLSALWGNRAASYSLINTQGYQINPSLIAAVNISSSSSGSHWHMGAAGAGAYSVSGKLTVAPGSKYVVLYAKTINRLDALPRTVYLEVSLDNSSWTTVKTTVMNSANSGMDHVFPYVIQPGFGAIAYRVRIDPGASPNNVDFTGIIALGAVSI